MGTGNVDLSVRNSLYWEILPANRHFALMHTIGGVWLFIHLHILPSFTQ